MNQKSRDTLLRSDRVLVVALAIVLAAVSAVVGAAAAYRPHTEQIKTAVVIATPATPVAPEIDRPRRRSLRTNRWSKSSS